MLLWGSMSLALQRIIGSSLIFEVLRESLITWRHECCYAPKYEPVSWEWTGVVEIRAPPMSSVKLTMTEVLPCKAFSHCQSKSNLEEFMEACF